MSEVRNKKEVKKIGRVHQNVAPGRSTNDKHQTRNARNSTAEKWKPAVNQSELIVINSS